MSHPNIDEKPQTAEGGTIFKIVLQVDPPPWSTNTQITVSIRSYRRQSRTKFLLALTNRLTDPTDRQSNNRVSKEIGQIELLNCHALATRLLSEKKLSLSFKKKCLIFNCLLFCPITKINKAIFTLSSQLP